MKSENDIIQKKALKKLVQSFDLGIDSIRKLLKLAGTKIDEIVKAIQTKTPEKGIRR